MIVLVCGGRDYQDAQQLAYELSRIEYEMGKPIRGFIHGAARGADTLAKEWQEARIRAGRSKVPGTELLKDLWSAGYPADWATHGKAAGPIRNQNMLDQNPGIELVVAFPGGKGTADMVARAKKKGLPVICIATQPKYNLSTVSPGTHV